jgi:hypothetical protein
VYVPHVLRMPCSKPYTQLPVNHLGKLTLTRLWEWPEIRLPSKVRTTLHEAKSMQWETFNVRWHGTMRNAEDSARLICAPPSRRPAMEDATPHPLASSHRPQLAPPHLTRTQRWLQFSVGVILGLCLGGAGSFASVVFYGGVLVCSLIGVMWYRATATIRWFGFGLLVGFIAYALFYGSLIVWLLSQG